MKAFLSHASADKPLAKRIWQTLRDQAVEVWFDRLEIRPGDSLIGRITAGIGCADFLLVLVTPDSRQSSWVARELALAFELERQGKGPKIVPLLLSGCEIPAELADRLYVAVGPHGEGLGGVLPALFPDSCILDLELAADDLVCDGQRLQEQLYEFTRSASPDLRVRIDHQHFNTAVLDIVARTLTQAGLPPPVAAQVRLASESLAIELPVYWANLAVLCGQLAAQVFVLYGRNLDAVSLACQALLRALGFAQFRLSRRLAAAVFPGHARQFGHPAVARFLERFDTSPGRDEESLVREVCELDGGQDLADAGIEGDRARHIADSRLWLPVSADDRVMLQFTCAAAELITHQRWCLVCLPQMLGRHLGWTAFREARPLHELDYAMGFALEDYPRVGFG